MIALKYVLIAKLTNFFIILHKVKLIVYSKQLIRLYSMLKRLLVILINSLISSVIF